MSSGKGEIISKDSILEMLEKNKLIVTPMIDEEEQVSAGTIDLRLNTEFITTKRTKFRLLDPVQDSKSLKKSIQEYQEKTYAKLGDGLVLHPNQFALGSTLEYVKLPNNITAKPTKIPPIIITISQIPNSPFPMASL